MTTSYFLCINCTNLNSPFLCLSSPHKVKMEPFFPDAQPTSLRASTAYILFTTCAPNLGFMILDSMTLDMHILTVCISAYVQIRRIRSIRLLAVEATKILVGAVNLQVRLL